MVYQCLVSAISLYNTSRQHPHPHPSPYPIHRVQIYISPIRFTTTASPQQCLPVSAACETLYFHQDQPHSAPAFTQPKTQTYLGTPHQSSLFPSGLQSRGPDVPYPTSRVGVQPQCKRTSLTELQQRRECECVCGRSGSYTCSWIGVGYTSVYLSCSHADY
jgi:hypothetical protein